MTKKKQIDNQKYISVYGAREHNLKNLTLHIPRDKLIIFTGLSGSGKSSLAFDTIYAEGQRRYIESLSAYARQFLEMMQKPDVDQIDGLSPAIAIEQKTTNRNPRSTVGTVTEIYDYMRLLFARIGIPYSPTTNLPIQSQTISQMVDKILNLEPKTRFYLLAPLVRGRKGEYKKEFLDLQKKGFLRVKVDGEFYEIADVPLLEKNYKHDIDVVVDRLILSNDIQTRLANSLETALSLSNGLAIIEFVDKSLDSLQNNEKKIHKSKNETHEQLIFSEKFSCPVSGFTIPEIEPRIFSFNNPFGACPKCNGLGVQQNFDPKIIIADDSLTLRQGAITPWSNSSSLYYQQTLSALAKAYDFDLDTPWRDLSSQIQKLILEGSGKKLIDFIYQDHSKIYKTRKSFEGVIPNLERHFHETNSAISQENISRYMVVSTCPSCKGYRLKETSLMIKIENMHIGEVATLSIQKAYQWFENIKKNLGAEQKNIANSILKEIQDRLTFLINVGLEYLTLARSSQTLSGGENQRIRLASQIGSGLLGVLYVLDEPSIGLHQRDNERLLKTLQHLRDLGNTVLVVEHDEDAILMADHVVDIGPKAGFHGGEIIAQGSAEEIIKNPNSLTGQYLSGKRRIETPIKKRKIDKKYAISIQNAYGNNLKNISTFIPLGNFVCVTGVSGSGKSTFLLETLFKAASQKIMKSKMKPAPYEKIKGLDQVDKVIDVDQSPIGRTPRSNPATYIGVFTPIREWFANLPEAKARGYKAGRFSFNVKGGRCEACQGDGVKKIEMHFLSDVYVTCEICKGKRYNRESLEILYKNKTISDVLDMTVEEALDFFSAIPSIHDKLTALHQVGLSYIRLGQQATTLSGGEAQRVKLAKELSRKSTGKTLYILDEPTTGLHFHDINQLLKILQELVDRGNSVIVIEHNLDIINTADWIIDFGPEGGDNGGEIVAQGRVDDIRKEKKSYTGQFLNHMLEQRKKRFQKH